MGGYVGQKTGYPLWMAPYIINENLSFQHFNIKDQGCVLT